MLIHIYVYINITYCANGPMARVLHLILLGSLGRLRQSARTKSDARKTMQSPSQKPLDLVFFGYWNPQERERERERKRERERERERKIGFSWQLLQSSKEESRCYSAAPMLFCFSPFGLGVLVSGRLLVHSLQVSLGIFVHNCRHAL